MEITDAIGLEVILHDIVVTHVQGLIHHLIEVERLTDCLFHSNSDEATHEYEDDQQNDDTYQNEQGEGRGVIMDAFGMEILITDKLEFSRLFESCIAIIDGIYKFLVIADDTQLSGRDVDIVKDNIVKTELLDLQTEGNLTPGGVLVLAIADT